MSSSGIIIAAGTNGQTGRRTVKPTSVANFIALTGSFSRPAVPGPHSAYLFRRGVGRLAEHGQVDLIRKWRVT